MQWKRLDWLPDYEISENGRVRRITKGLTRSLGHEPKGSLRQRDGVYWVFKLMLPNGSKRIFQAHRLVCEAFHGPPPSPKHHAAHWDGDGLNNRFDNLRWATPAENIADKIRHGRVSIGARNGRAKLTDDQVRVIRSKFSGKRDDIRKLCKEFNLSRSAMRSVCSGEHWQHVR